MGILSPRLRCPVFPHSLLFICSLLCFLLSQLSDCALLLSVSASHFALTAVNRRSVEVGSPMNPSAEESRQRLMEKTQQTIKRWCMYVPLCVSLYDGYQERLIAFHFCQQNTGPLKPYQFPLIAVRPPANHMNNTQTHA